MHPKANNPESIKFTIVFIAKTIFHHKYMNFPSLFKENTSSLKAKIMHNYTK